MLFQRYSAGRAALFGRRAVCCRRAIANGVRVASLSTQREGACSANSTKEPIHITIVGGGAAGLTAAFFAAEHGAKVTVLERTKEAGKKILMSGGSRCNVLPLQVDLQADYHSECAPSAVRAVFASWNLEACRAWLEDPYWGVGVDLTLEEETRKYFPTSNSAKEVRDRLVAACLSRGVTFRYNASVEGLLPLGETREQPQQQQQGQQQNTHLQQQQQQQQHQQQQQSQQQEVKLSQEVLLQQRSQSTIARSEAAVARLPASSEAPGAELAEAEVAAVDEADADAVRRASGATAGPSTPAASVGGASDGGGGGSGSASRRGKKGRCPRGGPDTVAAAAADAPLAAAPAAPTKWLCRLRDGTEHVTDKLIIATGGLSFPAVGTDGTGHRILRTLGHHLSQPYPALTPLKGGHPAGEQLAGVSMYGIELSVQQPGSKRPKVSERTALLFTHRGYSGPAVLDLSHFAVRALEGHGGPPVAQHPQPQQQTKQKQLGQQTGSKQEPADSSSSSDGGGGYLARGLPALRVNWTSEPAAVWDERLRSGGTMLVTTLLQRHGLRERLAEALVSELGLGGTRVCDVRKSQRAQLVSALTSYELPYSGHEGYKKAEVTGGGVRLEELDCATMESRILPGLFICGECVDVFGRIGGFNFYWAWVSGRLAGIGAAQGGLHPKSSKGRAGAKAQTAAAATA